jgi:hypothetical protein
MSIEPQDNQAQLAALKGQIAAWRNRAAMARQQGNKVLEQQAQEKVTAYENAVARLREFELD